MVGGKRPQKAAILVAQQIVRDAVQGGPKVGESLPPERVMLEKYQIGRGTLREALRLLEFQGVIALKPGPGGGPVLLDPDSSHLASAIVLLMQFKRAPFRTIVEVRSAMEPMISALAARRVDAEQLAQLAQTVADMREHIDDQRVFLDANKRFHDVIAWSSGNALFGCMVDSLLDIMDGTVVGLDYPPARRTAILNAHTVILDALQAKDPDLAEQRMRDHIDAYTRYVERKYPDLLDQVIEWDRLLT